MSKIRKSARDQDCLVRFPGICQHRSDTVVLAHRNGYGIAGKNPDFQGAYACYECHKHIDSHYDDTTLRYFYEGVFRTQMELLKQGLMEVKG